MKIKITKLDDLWRKLIKARDKKCRRCGREGRLEAAHIIGRRCRMTRWLPLNGLALCHTCHRWNHEQPLDFADWVRQEIGESGVEKLREQQRRAGQGEKVDLKWMMDFLVQQLEET